MQQTMKQDADFWLEDLQARVVRRVDRAVRWKKAREVGEIVGTWVAAVALCFAFWRDIRH
jgi:hypothetical protein